MSTLPPPPALGPLTPSLLLERDQVTLRVPPADYRKRALVLVLALPALLLGLAVLVGLQIGLQDGDALWAILFVGAAAGSAACLVAGGVMLALAGFLSRRSHVVLDLSRRRLRPSPSGPELSWDEVAAVAVVHPAPLLKWWRLQARTRDGRVIPLRRRLPPAAADEAEALAEWCGELLGVPVEVPAELGDQDALGLSGRWAAVLCYLPLQGIFLIASLYALATGRDRPFVRFCAKQSLAHFVASVVVMLLCLALGAPPLALAGSPVGRGVAAGWLALLLVGFLVWNVGARIVACVRAWRGQVWVMPWLAPLVRSWAPATPPPWAGGGVGVGEPARKKG